MPILWFMEYDISQDEEANKKYLHYIFDEGWSCQLMDICEKIDAKHQVWVDDSHHLILTVEFATSEEYERMAEDPEWQKWLDGQERLKELVQNVNIRLMRPAGE